MDEWVRYVTQVTPWGDMVLAASDKGLVAMRFSDQGIPGHWQPCTGADRPAALVAAVAWLVQFSRHPQGRAGKPPALDESRITPFQRKVWQQMDRIPCGQTQSYADLAQRLGTSPRAVGRAVGSNPWLLLRPCHRVVGASGALTGYAGGIARKKALLAYEAS